MPDRDTDAKRAASVMVLAMMLARSFRPITSAVVLCCGLAAVPAKGQTISETANEIEAMVDFSGSAIVDGDVVERVDWVASEDECTFGLTVTGTTEGGRVGTEFGTTLDFRSVPYLRIEASAAGPDVFRVTLRPKEQDFDITARIVAEAADDPSLAEWKEMLASGKAAGECDETSCDLRSTGTVATVIVVADANQTNAAKIERPFQILALLCEAAPKN